MKKIIILTLICLFVLANQTFAHTGLQSSDPVDGSTVSESLSDITLTFETVIEQTSTFELQNGSGETVPVNDITISDNVMEGSLSEPLVNDQYVVLWNIIGVDGHPIEGNFSFTVDAPLDNSTTEEDTDATEEESLDNEDSSDGTDQSDSTETDVTETETETESTGVQAEGSNTLMIVIIVVLVVAVAGIVWLRRKK